MADIKWIKMATNLFDNRKIRQIECLPDGYAIIVVWMKLLCLAGNVNNGGYIYFTKDIPYTEQMLSAQFNMPIPTLQLALRTFEQFGMIEVVDDILHISNWEKYQNTEGMERIRKQTRQRVAKHREKHKLLQCNVTVTQCNATDKDKEIDKELYIINNVDKKTEDADKKIKNRNEEIREIVDYLNVKVKPPRGYTYKARSTVSHINARLNEGFTVDDFKIVIDKKCEEWVGTKFEEYLRPMTLFGTKFESYLNQKTTKKVRVDEYDGQFERTDFILGKTEV